MYTEFGLNIQSEIELPELLISEGSADVIIALGNVPATLDNPSEKTPWFEIGKGQFLLRVDGIAKYYVENGSKIIIEPDDQTDMQDIRLFLLNTVIAVLLLQRNYIVLHGAAVIIDGRAKVLVGASGTGKSSLAMLCYDRGNHLIADEICGIKVLDGKAFVYPGIPQLNVWQDTLLRTDKNADDYLPIRRGLKKYGFCIKKQFAEEEVKLSDIILINTNNEKAISMRSITGGKKLEGIIRNSFFPESISDKKKFFFNCKAITDQARFYDLGYNTQMNQLDQVLDMIVREVDQ